LQFLYWQDFFSGAANATDYHVSSIHTNRSDASAGTSSNEPWETFDKVKTEWSNLNSGDMVHLEKGRTFEISFSSPWYLSNGGNEGTPITLRGDDYGSSESNRPIVHRTGGIGIADFANIQSSYITIRDIEFNGGNNDYNQKTPGIIIWCDQKPITGINILNNKIHNLGGENGDYVCGIWLSSQEGTSNNLISDCLSRATMLPTTMLMA